MSFIFESVNNLDLNTLSSIASNFELSDNKDSSCYENGRSENIEKELLDNALSRAVENKSRLHILYDERDNNSIPCGLISLNFEMVGSFSSLSVDYIFVSNSYRGIYFEEIKSKISFFIFNFVIQEALLANKISPLDAITLSPINECVSKVYKEFGFDNIDDGWLYIFMDDIV